MDSKTPAADLPPPAALSSKCQLEVTTENAVVKYIAKGAGQTFLCKGCHATDVMMGRHFGKLPSVWDRLTEEEQV